MIDMERMTTMFIFGSNALSQLITIVQSALRPLVTKKMFQETLMNYEPKFNKNSAFNKNFSDDSAEYKGLGRLAAPGVSQNIARADHVHPIGINLKYAENRWDDSAIVNILPDTRHWVMSNGEVPTLANGDSFKATFKSTWEGCTCFFTEDMLAHTRGNKVRFGVNMFKGAYGRLELIVDGASAGVLFETDIPATCDSYIPANAKSVSFRVVIYKWAANADRTVEFTGVRLYNATDEDEMALGNTIYLTLRKVQQKNVPLSGVGGTIYITERGNMYLAGDDDTMIPLAGSEPRDILNQTEHSEE